MNARDFFNRVSLMLTNKNEYAKLASKTDRTEDEEMLMGKYLDNYKEFERVIWEEVVRVNEMIKKGELK